MAITGMACRFPGAPDVDSFWELLRTGRDATGKTPADRYDVDAFYAPEPSPGKVAARRSGYLPRVGDFDSDTRYVPLLTYPWQTERHWLRMSTD
ncbi:beta-ketoacyl synthase N-terminal-like domain-containing protein [Streptomyces sp. NPDC006602]|uniref:beta-ketoacyl synthase N-terminal-like domain-containing protein n=1 Tax=Streptomyces sp. NPDC006602 TaxID=3364751 RepID=UPI00369A5B6D